MKTTLKNTILALMILAPAGTAFAAGSGMEAVGACPQCEMGSASGNGLQAIPVSVSARGVASTTGSVLPNLSSLAVQIGRVQTVKDITDENGVTGTGEGLGVMLSPCTIITNQHQIYGAQIAPDLTEDRPVGFYFGRGVSSFRWKLDGNPIRVGARTIQGGKDWALVRLSVCAGKKVGYPELDLRTPEQLTNVDLYLVAISPNVENGILSSPVKCMGKGRDPLTGALLHNCPVGHGSSGGGLFTADGKLVAIVGGKNASGFTAITMSEIMADAPARSLVETDKQNYLGELGQGTALSALTVTRGRQANL